MTADARLVGVISLPEEVQLSSILESVQVWQDKLKHLVQVLCCIVIRIYLMFLTVSIRVET